MWRKIISKVIFSEYDIFVYDKLKQEQSSLGVPAFCI